VPLCTSAAELAREHVREYATQTFAICVHAIVNHILCEDDSVISAPDELLRSNLLVAVLLCRPTRRESPANKTLAAARRNEMLFAVKGWNLVSPALASTKAAAGGVPLGGNDGGT
jgi:hypothetical protein